jgi:hypothetical protein
MTHVFFFCRFSLNPIHSPYRFPHLQRPLGSTRWGEVEPIELPTPGRNGMQLHQFQLVHWIGLRENLQETMVFTIKYRAFRLKFSHHPILWLVGGFNHVENIFLMELQWWKNGNDRKRSDLFQYTSGFHRTRWKIGDTSWEIMEYQWDSFIDYPSGND